MAKTILCDACYWIALLDSRDAYHCQARSIFKHIGFHQIITPYPVLYEVISTRLVKRKDRLLEFGKILQKHWEIVCDKPYRDDSIHEIVHHGNTRNLSLVDVVIRKILQNDARGFAVHALVTFNEKDFYDVCESKNITLINQYGIEALS